MNLLSYRKAAKHWFNRAYHSLNGPSPLHPKVWEGRLKPVHFRRYAPSDLKQCLDLYAINEPGRFPKSVAAKYLESLTRQTSYFLVAERDGRIAASGGMSYFDHPSLVCFCFGLVHPDYQGQGLGTTLVLARLALLNPKRQAYRVMIFAVEKSIAFYRRMGFLQWYPWPDANNENHPSGHLVFTARQVRSCRKLLTEHGVTVPPDQDLVPFRAEMQSQQTTENEGERPR